MRFMGLGCTEFRDDPDQQEDNYRQFEGHDHESGDQTLFGALHALLDLTLDPGRRPESV